jgi:hypothetical protein
MSDEDDEFRKHILMMVQIFTLAIALCVLAMVYYIQPETTFYGKNEVRTEGRAADRDGAT